MYTCKTVLTFILNKRTLLFKVKKDYRIIFSELFFFWFSYNFECEQKEEKKSVCVCVMYSSPNPANIIMLLLL